MSCIIKITYQHKHKKYRFHKDKPINFNQIRQQFSIFGSSSSILYHLESIDPPLSQPLGESQNQMLIFNESELLEYLKNIDVGSIQTIRIKIIPNKLTEIREDISDTNSDQGQLTVPTQIKKLRSRSDQIQLSKPELEESSDSMEITQQFLYNSQIEFFKLPLSREIQELEKQLAQNSRKSKLTMERRHFTDIQKLYSYMRKITQSQL